MLIIWGFSHFKSFLKIHWVAVARKELGWYPGFCRHLHQHLRTSSPEDLSWEKPPCSQSKWHIKNRTCAKISFISFKIYFGFKRFASTTHLPQLQLKKKLSSYPPLVFRAHPAPSTCKGTSLTHSQLLIEMPVERQAWPETSTECLLWKRL